MVERSILNRFAKSVGDFPFLRAVIIAARALEKTSDSGLRFALISVPKDLMVVVWEVVEG